MGKITARAPRELKEGMERYPSVSWGDVVRRAIEDKLRGLRSKGPRVMGEIAIEYRRGPGGSWPRLIGGLGREEIGKIRDRIVKDGLEMYAPTLLFTEAFNTLRYNWGWHLGMRLKPLTLSGAWA